MLSVHFSLCVVATGDLSCSLPWPGLCLSCVLPCGIVHSSMLESPPCRWFCTGQEAVLGQGLRLIPRHCVLHADAAVLGAGLLESHWQHYLLCAQWLVVSNSFVTPWTVTYQVLLSVGFPTQEYWSGLPFPPPGDLPDQGSNPGLLHLPHLRRIRHLGSPKLKPTDYKLSQHFNYVTPSTLPCMKEKKYPGNRAI